MSWFDDNKDALKAAGISEAQARDFVARNPGDEHRAIEALTNDTGDRMYDSQGPEINNGNGGTLSPDQWTRRGGTLANDQRFYPVNSYGGMAGGLDFGGAPAPFGETYTTLGRPSYLQGEYVPGQWNETFRQPEKPSVLQTPYALPTKAELEASAGYTAGADLMQRGMERSAAAKGSVLSGGFVGRTLPRAMGEYAGTAYGNLVGQTLGARQQQVGEYQGDVSNAFSQYQQRYGQFADAEGLKLGARNVNESAYQADEGANLAGYKTRYGAYLDQAGMKRQAENDLWSRNRDLSDLSLRAAALARP